MFHLKQMSVIKRIILLFFCLGLICSIVGILHIKTNVNELQYESLEELVVQLQASDTSSVVGQSSNSKDEKVADLDEQKKTNNALNEDTNKEELAIADKEMNINAFDEYTTTEPFTTEELNELKININTATAEQFQQLKGIGPTKAAAIVAERERAGPFKSIEDVKRVKGIGDKTFQLIKESLVY